MNNWCICWFFMYPLNAELNSICHLLATIFVVSRLRVKCPLKKTQPSCPGSRDLNWTGKGLKIKPVQYSEQPFQHIQVAINLLTRVEIARYSLGTNLVLCKGGIVQKTVKVP